MLKFYRKLDLLNRLYILNHYKLQLLDQSAILNLPDNQEINPATMRVKPYANLQDLHLLVYCVSNKWIKYIFEQVLVNVIAKDKAVTLNAPLLSKIKQSFSIEDVEFILNNTIHEATPNIHEILVNYDLVQIVKYLIYIYFTPLKEKLAKELVFRFPISDLDSELLSKLEVIDLNQLVETQLQQSMPQTYNVILDLIKS